MNHTACNVESRPLNFSNAVSNAQLVEFAADVFELFLYETSAAHPASRQPWRAVCTLEATPDTVGGGEHDEGVSDRGVILMKSEHGTS